MRAAFLNPFRQSPAARRRLAALLCAGLLGGCATPYVVPEQGAASVPALQDRHARMDDGFELPLRSWLPDAAPRAVLLAVHGLNDYSRAYDELGRRLAADGIAVYAYDQRGFGGTLKWGYWHGSERLVRDLDAMTQLLRRRYPDRPVFVLGESMGGAVVLSALADQGFTADGVVLVAPAVWSRDAMPFYQRWGLAIMAHTLPGELLTGKAIDIRPTDNIDMLRAWARDPLVIKATRVDVLYGLTNLMDRAMAAAPRVHGSVLLLYGAHDELVPKQALCHFLAAVPVGDAGLNLTTAFYPDGYHMLTRDLDGQRVQDDIAQWILNRPGFVPASRLTLCDGGAEIAATVAGELTTKDTKGY